MGRHGEKKAKIILVTRKERRAMKIQTLYDLRELTGFVSGTDLQDMFHEILGEMSPSGNCEIGAAALASNDVGKEALRLLAAPLVDVIESIMTYGMS